MSDAVSATRAAAATAHTAVTQTHKHAHMASDNAAAVGQGSRPSQRTTRESIERSGLTVDTGVHRCLTFTRRRRVAQIMETHKRVTHKNGFMIISTYACSERIS